MQSSGMPTASAEGPQQELISDIADDTNRLIQKARETLGVRDIVLDSSWSVGHDFQKVDPSIRALIVRQDCAWGAVRVNSNPGTNVVTGPGVGNGVYFVTIREGQSCRFFQNPAVRFFRLL